MPFSSKHVLFRYKRNHFWIRSILIKGSRYFINQKSDQKIEQTPGPDEITSNIRRTKLFDLKISLGIVTSVCVLINDSQFSKHPEYNLD